MACAFVNDHEYIGSRYVPQLEGAWDINKDYENFSIVTDTNNNSYTSKKNVPAGIELSNNEYWVMTGNFNAQVQQLINENTTIKNDIVTINQTLLSLQQQIDELKTS